MRRHGLVLANLILTHKCRTEVCDSLEPGKASLQESSKLAVLCTMIIAQEGTVIADIAHKNYGRYKGAYQEPSAQDGRCWQS